MPPISADSGPGSRTAAAQEFPLRRINTVDLANYRQHLIRSAAAGGSINRKVRRRHDSEFKAR
jgi:hypothetical protein